MFETRWSTYPVETKDVHTFAGLIQSETSDVIVLTMMGAKETISRSAIKDMKGHATKVWQFYREEISKP